MKLAVPKEIREDERRVALIPDACKKLVQAGIEVLVESGAGGAASFDDKAYQAAGAKIVTGVASLLGEADFVVKVQPPMVDASLGKHEVEFFKPGAMLLGTLYPTRNLDTVRRLVEHKITAFATDCIPRVTRAQSMDTLSSMATVSGYKGVLIAANHLPKFFPMFMTAAGTVLAAKAFVIGAGVAGLQAIAMSRKLGAVVEATDTRSVVKEQIESLGARFMGVESAEDAQTAGGYAKEMSADFQRKQAELIAQRCAAADVVIPTALIGGVKAPKLITEDMVKGMKPGSVIVDLAADGGGNCVLSELGKTVVKHGVTIAAPLNLPATMPVHASQMYGRNLTTFVLEFYKEGAFQLKMEDEILKGCMVTHQGQVLHGPTQQALQSEKGGAA